MPRLFAIGQAVDVTGWLGGYNFQWAWSSGWVAGEGPACGAWRMPPWHQEAVGLLARERDDQWGSSQYNHR